MRLSHKLPFEVLTPQQCLWLTLNLTEFEGSGYNFIIIYICCFLIALYCILCLYYFCWIKLHHSFCQISSKNKHWYMKYCIPKFSWFHKLCHSVSAKFSQFEQKSSALQLDEQIFLTADDFTRLCLRFFNDIILHQTCISDISIFFWKLFVLKRNLSIIYNSD